MDLKDSSHYLNEMICLNKFTVLLGLEVNLWIMTEGVSVQVEEHGLDYGVLNFLSTVEDSF